ncbi:MAG: ABC-F family ATP-binding cassette domain-containing protein [Rhodospirillaceae bacterium]|jgi:ATP-binding cassette, subfamily F, member 3|nr:ABC-F family ATP-binding cassette domain-containing protein [Rhodospirillaceae bacterium]MBT5896407.1 ABC-F family ATP-binding cassette domain-containing protein [Rhodospirillaceae bacterium]MBT6429675.1 ABC-F family ATP-binding cassette domain-containing protein [Rhodospirillaceae bacterium]
MLHINDLTYRIGGRDILTEASAHIPKGHKVGVVGRNGAGKSTLFKLIMGELSGDGGSIRCARRARMGMLAQEAPGGSQTLLDNVLEADTERTALLAEADSATAPDRIGEIHQRLLDIEAHAAPARAAAILAGLGFDEAAQVRPLSEFSGGWRMRVALAAILFAAPDLLLLDEPTNYLDLEGTLWLEDFLRRYPHTVLLVSHDRDLLNNAVTAILHVDRGGLTLYRGGYDTFEETRRERQLQQERLRQRQEAARSHMQAYVDRFRYQANKARQAQSRLKALARMQPIAEAVADPSVNFRFPEPDELRSPMISVDRASVGYDEGVPILSGMDIRIDAKDRIALLGRNGNGKTTLAKLIEGRLAPMTGEIRRSSKLRTGFFAQHQIEDLHPQDTPVAHLQRLLPDLKEPALRARLGTFGLIQDRAETAVRFLSGGERARLVLALITAKAPHLLILDEPTNHLDVDARQALVQALNDFPGAVLLISHDRHLLELTTDRLWLVADGKVTPWEGDIDDYRRMAVRNETPKDENQASEKDRRATRRANAQARQRLAPLRKIVKAAEQKMTRLQADQERIAKALADPALYQDTPDKLADLNQQRAQTDKAIAKAEAAWLAAEETLEAAQA